MPADLPFDCGEEVVLKSSGKEDKFPHFARKQIIMTCLG
jgi:hypothetical protein